MHEHELLLERWSKLPYHGKDFVKDGIIDPTRWQTVTPKVLFVLKESYGGPKDLRKEILDTGYAKWNIWWKAAYWCYACHHVFRGNVLPPFPADDSGFEEASDLFLSSAVINIKKSHGQHPSDDDDLARYVRKDADLIRQQIELIKPNILISGNVWWADELWPNARPVYDLVWQVGERLLVNFWHPSWYQPDNKLFYYTLGCLLTNAIVRSRVIAAA